MYKKMLNCIVVLACMQSSLCLANDITVVEQQGTEGDVWVTKNAKPNVAYADSACGNLSKSVLLNIVADANAGVFNWNSMRSAENAKHILDNECKRLQNEVIYRLTGIDRNK